MQGMQLHLLAKIILVKLVRFEQIWLDVGKIKATFRQKWLDLGKIKIVHPQKYSIS